MGWALAKPIVAIATCDGFRKRSTHPTGPAKGKLNPSRLPCERLSGVLSPELCLCRI